MAEVAEGRVLILLAHPALQKSRVNAALAASVRGLPGVTLHDLYEAYPDLLIDVRAEQRLLAAHRVVVMQHPFFWYSTPAILKEWQDVVLEHGWAYGHGGTALRGKRLVNAVSTGGGEAAYCRGGRNAYGVRELLVPISQTAALCGMHYLAPFVVYGTHRLGAREIAAHAERYRGFIEAL